MAETGKNSIETGYNPHSVAIVTATFYPGYGSDELQTVRGDLGLHTLQNLALNGNQVVLIDGGSTPEYLLQVEGLGITPQKELQRGMSASRMQGFTTAAELPGSETIVWMEPEKLGLADHIQAITEPIRRGEADIVLPARRRDLFESSYPGFQVESELEANATINAHLRQFELLQPDQPDLDFYFGPRAFGNSPEIARHFLQQYGLKTKRAAGFGRSANPAAYSNAIFFPVVSALHAGLRVASVEIPFTYPPEQKAEEEADYRKNAAQILAKRKAQREMIVYEMYQQMRMLTGRHSNLQPMGEYQRPD